ncbi:MAG: DUF4430 domain-containing protein [Candidatus Hadarchaeum sp.]|uniref:DUF4430 domain-containing protein n=1 Tax=Candidatus Hadarchaeum sp. TaxID=2883567 RepID=UPI003170F532
MNKGLAAQVLALVIVVGFLGFAGGYYLAGGMVKQTEQYTYGENITVRVKIADLGIDKEVTLCKGMTPFDALLKVASMRTEFYESFGASIVTEIGGLQQSWGYRVNGVEPTVGMQDYQLRDGDLLELVKLVW